MSEGKILNLENILKMKVPQKCPQIPYLKHKSICEFKIDLSKWANVKSVAKATDTTKKVTEDRYFISTLPYEEIERIAHNIRNHWQIENNLQGVLGIVFREDESRIRDENTAMNFACLRKMAISLLEKDGTSMSYRKKMLRNWATPENIMNGLLS